MEKYSEEIDMIWENNRSDAKSEFKNNTEWASLLPQTDNEVFTHASVAEAD